MSVIQEWAERVDNLAPLAKRVGDKADEYACDIIARLVDINESVRGLYGRNPNEYPRLNIGAGDTKVVEGREGYIKVIKTIAVVAAGACNVDVFIISADNSGFVWRVELAGAGNSSKELDIPTPEGVAIYVKASSAAQVNLVLERVKP